MRLSNRGTPRVLVALPILAVVAGGTLGWFTRDSGAAPGADPSTVSVAPLPGGTGDDVAPAWHLDSAPNPMVIDRSRIVGHPDDIGTAIPKGAVVPLALDSAGAIVPVDAATLAPASPAAPLQLPPVAPVPLTAAIAPPAPPSTIAADDESTTTTTASATAGFVDPCTTADPACAGAAARVVATPNGDAARLDPLRISVPFAATGAYADMCADIERGAAPDGFLPAAVRPTIAVVVNQPSSIALSGSWSDNVEIEKRTMVTSSDQEAVWRQAWEERGEQLLLLSCLTLPLDEVRAHAGGGRADVHVSLLGISATGRADMAGRLTLTVPLDQQEPPFADGVTITSLGEQRAADGTLVPTVHVHAALTVDGLVPKVSTLDPRTTQVYVQQELVEAADCAGWANNAQGVTRTAGSTVELRQEQRTIGGRATAVTAIDTDMALDPALPGGWQGFACMKVFAADRAGNRVIIALRGAQVQSPLTAVYQVGAVIDDSTFPDGWSVEVSWTDSRRVLWCGPVELAPTQPGASCTTFARSHPDGIVLVIRAIDDTGERRPAFVVGVPVNSAYCTPDDPFVAAGDGCATGFTETVRVPVDPNARDTIGIALQIVRTAQSGSVQTSPAYAWLITATQAFQF